MKTRGFHLIITALLLVSVALAACSTAAPTSPAAQALMDTANTQKTRAADEASAVVEEVSEAVGAGITVGDMTFTLDDLAGLATATASTEDGDVSGASLLALLEAAGITEGTVSLVASDGYSADVALADIDDTAVLALEEGKVNAVIPTASKGSWVKDIVSIAVK